MQLSHLYYFTKLAELEHYNNAAKELGISQPSLTYAIKTLEQELGIDLFQKQGRGVKLTNQGQVFASHINKGLYEIDKAIAIAQNDEPVMDSLNIGSVSSVFGDFLPQLIRDFKDEYGKIIAFNLEQGSTEELVKGLDTDRFDIVFSSFTKEADYLEHIPVLSHELVLVVSKEHPLANKKSVILNDLTGLNLHTYKKNTPVGNMVSAMLTNRGIKADYDCVDGFAMGGLVDANEQICALSSLTITLNCFNNIVTVPIKDVPKDFHHIYMIYKTANVYNGPELEKFVQFVKEYEVPRSSEPRK